jgi:phosphatidylserine decarboxylase
MRIHKEGNKTIALTGLIWVALNAVVFVLTSNLTGCWCNWIFWTSALSTLSVFLFIVSFFRIPNRPLTTGDHLVVSPCDGKVVVMEEMFDDEYFKEKRLQVSIFMSPANVHVNLNPASGTVIYSQYHKGKYLVAWNPKSSQENERHSVVIDSKGRKVLVKQIAGALAKRIVNYSKVGEQVSQTSELGFIKFGSRVDLLLPLDAKLTCKIGDAVKGGVDVIAEW